MGKERQTDSLSFYLKQIEKYPLLKHEEELALAEGKDAGKEAKKILCYGNDPNSCAYLTQEERERLLFLISVGQQSEHKLVCANLRLVVSIAKTYKRKMGLPIPLLELIQEGNIGLISAAKSFKAATGNRFSTFATYCIWNALHGSMPNCLRLIRIPNWLLRIVGKYGSLKQVLMQEDLDLHSRHQKIAGLLGVDMKRLSMIEGLMLPIESLSGASNETEELSLLSIIETRNSTPTIEDNTDILTNALRGALDSLSCEKRQIVMMRSGLTDSKKYTFVQISKFMNLDARKVRIMYRRALGEIGYYFFTRHLSLES